MWQNGRFGTFTIPENSISRKKILPNFHSPRSLLHRRTKVKSVRSGFIVQDIFWQDLGDMLVRSNVLLKFIWLSNSNFQKKELWGMRILTSSRSPDLDLVFLITLFRIKIFSLYNIEFLPHTISNFVHDTISKKVKSTKWWDVRNALHVTGIEHFWRLWLDFIDF